jgi:hypothetical protein
MATCPAALAFATTPLRASGAAATRSRTCSRARPGEPVIQVTIEVTAPGKTGTPNGSVIVWQVRFRDSAGSPQPRLQVRDPQQRLDLSAERLLPSPNPDCITRPDQTTPVRPPIQLRGR